MPTFDNVIITWDGAVVLPETEVSMDLKGIEKFIAKVCVQDAVYWGNPVATGTGTVTFDPPIAIKVRWDDLLEQNKVIASHKEDEQDRAVILTTSDLDVGGMIMLGTLVDILPYDTTKPYNIPNTFEIRKWEKNPMVKSSTIFVRKYYL